MDICGNIYVSKDIKNFSMKCIFCEKYMDQWEDFIDHIQSFHSSLENWVDPLQEATEDEIMIEYANDKNPEFIKIEPEVEKAPSPLAGDAMDDKDESVSADANEDDDYKPDDNSVNSNSDSDTDIDDEQESHDASKKFTITFYRRKLSTSTFIELYKGLPCLWDPNHEDYKNFPVRDEAHKKIIEAMRKKHRLILGDRAITAAIRKLRKQYSTVLQQKDKPSFRSNAVVLDYFKKCSFLGVFDDNPEDITKESDSSKALNFNQSSEVTLAFIEAYARFPVLYDTSHKDYTTYSVRKQCYETMSKILKEEHNTVFSDDELYKAIYQLRHWYYKTQDHQKRNKAEPLPEAQQLYLEKCRFLPKKIVKQKLPCEVCNKMFHNEMTIQLHLFKEHQIGEQPYKCPECERRFDMKSQLVVHQQRSHQGKIHQCKYCERKFAVLLDLRRHTETHIGVKPFVCELCGKAFRSKTQLGYHSNAIHTKTRAFKCHMCPKDFLKKRDLQDHIKAHLNIRDKICETCGKGFHSAHSLIRHRQIHSEIKKFACKLCDARYHQFVGLNAHMKRTHNIVKGQPKN